MIRQFKLKKKIDDFEEGTIFLLDNGKTWLFDRIYKKAVTDYPIQLIQNSEWFEEVDYILDSEITQDNYQQIVDQKDREYKGRLEVYQKELEERVNQVNSLTIRVEGLEHELKLKGVELNNRLERIAELELDCKKLKGVVEHNDILFKSKTEESLEVINNLKLKRDELKSEIERLNSKRWYQFWRKK